MTEPDKQADEKKKKAMVGQSSVSKQTPAAPAPLTRAPISQSDKGKTAESLQKSKKPPAPQATVSVEQAAAVPVAQGQPTTPPAQQAGPPASPAALASSPQVLIERFQILHRTREGKMPPKYMKAEKEAQFYQALKDGLFKTGEGKAGLVNSYERLKIRHKKHERYRVDVALGREKFSKKFQSKRFDDRVAWIRESCKDDHPNPIEEILDTYEDEEYYSTDTDEQVDHMALLCHVGLPTMRQLMPPSSGSATGSSSKSGGEQPLAPPPPPDSTSKPTEQPVQPDLDATIVMDQETPSGSKTKKKSKMKAKTSTSTEHGVKAGALKDALKELAKSQEKEVEQMEMGSPQTEEEKAKEAEVRQHLEKAFGKLPESGQLTPSGAQAPDVSLQEVPAGLEEERPEEDVTQPREARGTTPINLELDKLHVSMPWCAEVVTPIPVVTLPPVIEQVASEEVEMAAAPAQEQVAPEVETAAPPVTEQVVPDDIEMTEEEVLQERGLPTDAMILFGKEEKDLSEEERAKLEEQRSSWKQQMLTEQQTEADEQLALQIVAEEQQAVDHLIQLGPAKTAAQLTAEEE